MIKIGDLIELEIDDIGANGEGIGHHRGYTIFVSQVLKKERVIVKIEFIKKLIANAKLCKIVFPSNDRVPPPCPFFGRCGGCDLMHVKYAVQLEYKQAALQNTFAKMIRKELVIEDVFPSSPLGYRNKVQLPFAMHKGEHVLGFYMLGTHKVVPINNCLLHGKWLSTLIEQTLSYVKKYNIKVFVDGKGVLRHLVARFLDNKLCVTLVCTTAKLPNINELYLSLTENFKDVSLYINVHKVNNNVIMGKESIQIAGGKQIIDIMGVKAHLHPLSFFQTNLEIMEKLYKDVIDFISPHPKMIVIDAYSGIGIMGAIMAKQGAQIINIDEVPEAILDADYLYSQNELSNLVENICGDASKVVPTILENVDETKEVVLILDPPRKGISDSLASFLSKVLESNLGLKLVYISCNPATLARDLSIINASIYFSIQPYDMFPQTKHIETVVFLESRSN